MLDRPPSESAWRSWTWILLCIGLTYASIPLASEFRSRFDAEALASLDRQRGAGVARILDQYLVDGYREFLKRTR